MQHYQALSCMTSDLHNPMASHCCKDDQMRAKAEKKSVNQLFYFHNNIQQVFKNKKGASKYLNCIYCFSAQNE